MENNFEKRLKEMKIKYKDDIGMGYNCGIDAAIVIWRHYQKDMQKLEQAAFERGKMLSKEAHCEKHGWACTKCDSCVKEAQIDEKKLAARIAESLSTFFKAGHMGYRSSSYNPDKEAKEVIEHARKA